MVNKQNSLGIQNNKEKLKTFTLKKIEENIN